MKSVKLVKESDLNLPHQVLFLKVGESTSNADRAPKGSRNTMPSPQISLSNSKIISFKVTFETIDSYYLVEKYSKHDNGMGACRSRTMNHPVNDSIQVEIALVGSDDSSMLHSESILVYFFLYFFLPSFLTLSDLPSKYILSAMSYFKTLILFIHLFCNFTLLNS